MLGLLVIFAIFGWSVSMKAPERTRTKARITETHFEERLMAAKLKEQAIKLGGMTNLLNEFILSALRTTNEPRFPFANRTNASSQFVDIWQTPFQVNLVGLTNFTIRSAGPNLKFGDADDIIFNSASNGFVKP